MFLIKKYNLLVYCQFNFVDLGHFVHPFVSCIKYLSNNLDINEYVPYELVFVLV